MNTATIPYPTSAEVAEHVRVRLSNRIARVPAIRPTTIAGRLLGGIGLALTPSPAGMNSDMANPAEWLSPGQRRWAEQQSAANGLQPGWLEQTLANRQRAGLAHDPAYEMTQAEYDDAVQQTSESADQVVANAEARPTAGNVRITRALTQTLGPCAALACPPPVGRYRGGAHGCTRQPSGDGLDSHHMPANSTTVMPREMGPAIQMRPSDHRQTSSYGGGAMGPRYAARRRMVQSGRTMQAFAMDAAEARAIATAQGDPTRYDTAILQATAYAQCLQANGLLR